YREDGTERFQDSHIRWEDTHLNQYADHPERGKLKSNDWKESIDKILHEHGIKSHRKDAVICIDAFMTASPEWFYGENKEDQENRHLIRSKREIQAYFSDCIEWFERNYGPVFNAVIHWDEDTPHVHIDSVPLKQNEDGTWKLCAKEIIGNKKRMSQMQTLFAEEVGAKYKLERGIEKSPEHDREHKTTLEHDIEVAEEKKKKTEQELEQAEQKLDAVNEDISLAEEKRVALHTELEELENGVITLKQAQEIKPQKKGLFDKGDTVTLAKTDYEKLKKRAECIDDIQAEKRQIQVERVELDKQATLQQNQANWLKQREDELYVRKYREVKEDILDKIDGIHMLSACERIRFAEHIHSYKNLPGDAFKRLEKALLNDASSTVRATMARVGYAFELEKDPDLAVQVAVDNYMKHHADYERGKGIDI
ncbi:MAG: plasmid recombination protein, partial [Lachnospiraceae bacterium]|nr:plasmid recombination protein [Lachnospiraceae bacterium]